MERNIQELKTILNMTLANYESGGWGTTSSEFRAQASLVAKWPNKKDLFDELVIKAYNLLENVMPVIKKVPKLQWFKDRDKTTQQIAVFKIIQFWVNNRMTYENISNAVISTGSFNISLDTNTTMTIGERIGMDAWAYIQQSTLWNMRVLTEDEFIAFTETANGNFEIIGRFDWDKFPVLS